jgi:hypothetical protein
MRSLELPVQDLPDVRLVEAPDADHEAQGTLMGGEPEGSQGRDIDDRPAAPHRRRGLQRHGGADRADVAGRAGRQLDARPATQQPKQHRGQDEPGGP